MNEILGLPFGRLTDDGRPRSNSEDDAIRYRHGRQLVDVAIQAVLAGADRTRVTPNARQDEKSGNYYRDLYAQPPITDAAEAQRIGQAVGRIVERACAMFQDPDELSAAEVDTFTPVSAEDTSPSAAQQL